LAHADGGVAASADVPAEALGGSDDHTDRLWLTPSPAKVAQDAAVSLRDALAVVSSALRQNHGAAGADLAQVLCVCVRVRVCELSARATPWVAYVSEKRC
jgi:hypothetical protein